MDLSKLNASDGTGEATQALVTGLRTAGTITFTTGSISHWPAKFIATAGTLITIPGTTSKMIDPATMLVFAGHTSAGSIVIDTIAPGYTDHGSLVNDVVIIKPTTYWADTIQAALQVSLNNDGTLKTGIVTSGKLAANSVATAAIIDWTVTPAKRIGGFAVGNISAGTFSTTGNKAITGLGFTPKLVRFALLATGTGATQTGSGAMTPGSQYYASTATDSGTGRARAAGTDGCIAFISSAGTVVMKAAYVSMDADGFTINVSAADGTFGVAYEAYA